MTQVFRYVDLRSYWRKGWRNGNWRYLSYLEKALYRAALWYANRGGSIVNEKLVEKLTGLVEKLKETKGMRVFKRGLKKAVELIEKGEESKVFAWAPQLKDWLKDPDYIFWLGISAPSGRLIRHAHRNPSRSP